MTDEVTETRQPEQNVERAESGLLQVKCDPSLKEGVRAKCVASGFSTLSDCLRTLARDFLAGRIQYKQGYLQGQTRNTPN